jgi:hypothetical protein
VDGANPDVQLISNLVVVNDHGEILFVRPDLSDDRWWLPSADLAPYQHPNERAEQVLKAIPGLDWLEPRMMKVESFRGRRGWHIMFDYYVRARGEVDGTRAGWYPLDNFPRTMHGPYEKATVQHILEAAKESEVMA